MKRFRVNRRYEPTAHRIGKYHLGVLLASIKKIGWLCLENSPRKMKLLINRSLFPLYSFIVESDNRVDNNQKCAYPSLVIANRWLNVRLDLISSLVLLFSILFAILSKDTITGGAVGLSISYALQVTQLLNILVRMTAVVETNIVANERMEEYNRLPKEAEWIAKSVVGIFEIKRSLAEHCNILIASRILNGQWPVELSLIITNCDTVKAWNWFSGE